MPNWDDILILFPKYSNVVMHSECQKEIIQLVQENEIPSFVASYRQRVGYLSQNLGRETFHREWFEVLKKAQGLRAIRFVSIRNLRILYLLENNKAYLLLAFEERQGHKNTEYGKYIEPALKRMNEKGEMQ